MRRRPLLFALLILLLVIVIALGVVRAASNSVGPSGLTNQSSVASAEQLKPPECNGITLNNLVINGNGAGQNDLILGTAGVNNLSGGTGNDCIVGGGGNDTLRGQGGNDVILGGPGNDTINGGAGTDICYRGGGTDTITNCETTNP
jgi:Ca2+-binding RTX toxin-like protein